MENEIATQLKETRSIVEMTDYTRDKLDAYSFIDISSTEGGLRLNESVEMAVIWSRELERNGAKVTEDDLKYATYTFNAWLQGDYIKKPVIVAAPPAFGKSTMLSVFLKYMVDKYPDTFGAVVVKERITDMEALKQQIGSKAFIIRGFDDSVMTREDYDDQFINQVGFNIVIMTTKQFELQTVKENLSEFTEFKDGTGTSRPRRILLIDEKPSLVVYHTLTVRGLNDFLSNVAEAGRILRGKLQPYYRKVLPVVNQLREKMESPEEVLQGKFASIDPNFRLPIQLVRDYSSSMPFGELNLMRAFERVVRNGGECHIFDGKLSIVSAQIVHYRFTLFNTFILDGTGTKDPDYNCDNFYLFAPNHQPSYRNVTFNICNQYNLSKASLKSSDETLDNIASMVKQIIADQDSTTLVVTYKEYVAELDKRLCDEIIEEKVIMKHFDGGRGSNAYIGADNAIYIGSLFKGTSYYAQATQAVVGDRIGDDISGDYDSSKKGIHFSDPFVNEYRQLDIAVNLVQETNRLRASRKVNDVNIYLFNRDQAMLEHIISSYPGATVKEFEPKQKLTGSKTAADLLIDYFEEMPAGEKIKGSQIYKDLDITRMTFNRILKENRVQVVMKKCIISKIGHSYLKERSRN